jgi:hypothetical protein
VTDLDLETTDETELADWIDESDPEEWPAWCDAASYEPGPSYRPQVPESQQLTPG